MDVFANFIWYNIYICMDTQQFDIVCPSCLAMWNWVFNDFCAA